ncbi:MAG: DUF932 domain-containing protein [Bacteroidetes bacterium]|nr:DUF932 domain-containing protein [Bacteroidota bacterium]
MSKKCIQSDVYDYEVEMVDAMTPEGNPSGMKLTRRTDDGTVLGFTSDHYGLVNNKPLVEKAETAFEEAGLEWTKRRFLVTNGLKKDSLGARFRAIYDFENENMEIATRREDRQVGDVMGMRLIVQNSFDRSLRLSFALGMVRLVCTNGMQTMERELDLTRKHSQKIDIDNLVTMEAVTKALGMFKSAGDKFSLLSQRSIEHDQGLNILANLAKTKVFSEKSREGIATIWNNPTHEEDKSRNLYNLYNATTQFLTENVAESRFEMSDNTGRKVLQNLSLAASNPARLDKLVKALPVAGAVANN